MVFSISLTTGKEVTVYAFRGATDGDTPYSGLTAVNGLLYGTTNFGGGPNNYGTVYSVDPITHAEKVIYVFQGSNDGLYPFLEGLLNVAGLLYGVTTDGGSGGAGTMFSLDPTSGVKQLVYTFQGGTDANAPNSTLIDVNGKLYGTTQNGGTSNHGTVYSVDLATGSETVVHSFGLKEDGNLPSGSLKKVGKTLYGTTQIGGTDNQGSVFSIDIASGKETVIYSFSYNTKQNPNDGSGPNGGLIDVGGTLYGTTLSGGKTCHCGTVFAYNLATNTETILHDFQSGTDGSGPRAGLIDVNGTLYGTTVGGGSAGRGTVFSIKP